MSKVLEIWKELGFKEVIGRNKKLAHQAAELLNSVLI